MAWSLETGFINFMKTNEQSFRKLINPFIVIVLSEII
jgi:hypothetical protein